MKVGMISKPNTGYWFLAAGYWLLVTGFWLNKDNEFRLR